MKIIYPVFLFICLLLFAAPAQAQDNPFSSAKQKTEKLQNTSSDPNFMQRLSMRLNGWQNDLRREMSILAQNIKSNPLGRSFWLFIFFSFVYGVLHALGPGHGKSIVFSYFLSRKGKIWQSALMGNLITFMHVFSAVIMITLLFLLLNQAGMNAFNQMSLTVKKISYALLIGIGLALAAKSIYELKTGSWKQTDARPQKNDLKGIVFISLATGLVPCPGAAIIFIFSLSLGIMLSGVAAMIALALGMGLTTTMFAIISLTSRSAVILASNRREKIFVCSYFGLALAGSLFISGFGVLMFMGAA